MIYPVDVMIVLGRAAPDGRLSKDGYARVRHAAELYKQGLAKQIVAPAKWGYKVAVPPPQTEAVMIRDGLITCGVPPEVILLEEKSCDTLGGAYFLKVDFVLPHNWKKILVVTSEDHLERTKYVFHKVFGDEYDIQYTCSKRVLSDDEFAASLIREKKSLSIMDATWVGPIVPGKHEMVEDVFKLHPGYSKTATLSAAEMEQKIQAQQVS